MSGWQLNMGCHQDQGKRKEQQDFFAMSDPSLHETGSDGGFVAVVADGMGGHAGGAQASFLAVQNFMRSYEEKTFTQTVPGALGQALERANAAVYAENRKAGDTDMGTTLLACVIQAENLFWISVGDSRMYLKRGDKMETVNREHSYGAEMDERVRAGSLSAEQAQEESRKRHMLTSYLGLKNIPRVDLAREPLALREGDQVILCSDGLYNTLSKQEIRTVLNAALPTQEKCELLVSNAMAKDHPKQDNITVVLLEMSGHLAPIVYDYPEEEEEQPNKMLIWSAVAVAVLLFGVAAGFGFMWLFGEREEPRPAVNATQTREHAESQQVRGEQGRTTSQQDEVQFQSQPEKYSYCTLQHLLKKLGLYKGALDGQFGVETIQALKHFQEIREEELYPTGIQDPATVKALRRHFYKYFPDGKEPQCTPPTVKKTGKKKSKVKKTVKPEIVPKTGVKEEGEMYPTLPTIKDNGKGLYQTKPANGGLEKEKTGEKTVYEIWLEKNAPDLNKDGKNE